MLSSRNINYIPVISVRVAIVDIAGGALPIVVARELNL